MPTSMKKKRYIIIDKDMGVFLGTYDGRELGREDDNRIYACFAANNPFGLTTACSFKSDKAANFYIKDMFHEGKKRDLLVAEVDTDTEFPHVVDIIKAGYTEHCHDMLDVMFETGNQTVH